MARKVMIQIRRGMESVLGTLAVGELGYCTDTTKLYIGTAAGNVLLVAAQSTGDMLKSIYDTNNNGKVDTAEVASSVPWSGVSEKPSTFTPATHTHDVLSVKPDNYKVSTDLPSTYDRGQTVFFSKDPANKFNGVSYCTVHTIKGYTNMAVVQFLYPYNVDAPICFRYGLHNSDSWLGWRAILTAGATWDQLKGV